MNLYTEQLKQEVYWRGFKYCENCKTYRPIFAFGQHKGHKFDLTNFCKECRNLLEICKKHKLKLEELIDIYKKYQNKCSICDRNKYEFVENLAIDHDHKTNKIRGLLCTNCNIGLGHFKDSIKLLENACIYLKGEVL